MMAIAQLLFGLVLAWVAERRLPFFAPFRGLARYLFALGLTLFVTTWIDFGCYFVWGWSWLQIGCSWGGRIALLVWLRRLPPRRQAAPQGESAAGRPWLDRMLSLFSREAAFVIFASLVVARFAFGIHVAADGSVWTNFNFIDTAFHLSVAESFTVAPRFPVEDINAVGFPLKYHFMADYAIAHARSLGLEPLPAIWLLNVLGAAALAGSVWATFERWLRLPRAWVWLAAVLFLFLNPVLLNLLHHLLFRPPFFEPQRFLGGVLLYPYFNFEAMLGNLVEPQRALLFSLPAVLAILHVAAGEDREQAPSDDPARDAEDAGWNTAAAFGGVCLMPFSHVVAFAVLAPCVAPRVWRYRRWIWDHLFWPLALLVAGFAQLRYIQAFGPPLQDGYSGFGVPLPTQDFDAAPEFLRRPLFWLFTNGDFFVWGGVSVMLVLLSRRFPEREAWAPARAFLRRWALFLAVGVGGFVLINVYRYSANWGDSNKFVFFLNLGLSLLVARAFGSWRKGRFALHVRLLLGVLTLLCLTPPLLDAVQKISSSGLRGTPLFSANERIAANLMRERLILPARMLTGGRGDAHFVGPLAALPSPTGIYATVNPYVSRERLDDVRRVYEEADMEALARLDVHYVCVSFRERLHYRLHPRWLGFDNSSLVFQVGNANDPTSVAVFTTETMLPNVAATPPAQ